MNEQYKKWFEPKVLRQEDMTVVGGLFAVRFVPEGDQVELYVEDDGFFHQKASFQRTWLNDLKIVAEAAEDLAGLDTAETGGD